MRIFILWIFLFFSLNYSFSQNNLPDWVASRPSPANVGYVSSVVIPSNWPADFGGGILVDFGSPQDDQFNNIILEAFDNQTPRQLRNTFS